MNFLFLENRQKTYFWEKVALHLEERGHTIRWLVQNHIFQPRHSKSANITLIPYPSRNKKIIKHEELYILENYPYMTTDRGRKFFHSGVSHYEYYKDKIKDILINYQPNLVVGESTLFHELLTIELCRKIKLAYVQPTSNRYPSGRFSLYALNTQIPIIESQDHWSYEDALCLAERIANSTELPFYMKAQSRTSKVRQLFFQGLARSRVLMGRIGGECYNTPSFTRKLILGQTIQKSSMQWKALERLPSKPKKAFLYPMQIQPESNIDIWGHPYSDQVNLIKRLLAAAPEDFEIAVKANPKAKYELSQNLLTLAKTDPRVCLLPMSLPMAEALNLTNGGLTVTGTVGFEAVCGKGRILSLKHPIIENEFPNFHANTPEIAIQRLLEEPDAGIGNIEIGAKLIQRLVNQSFPGLISDPISHPSCMNYNNTKAVAETLERVIDKNILTTYI